MSDKPEWISTKDELPGATWFIALAPGRTPSVYVRAATQHDKVVLLGELEHAGVTHWIALPPWPKDV